MKFASQLELYALKCWADSYIRYRMLKSFLTQNKSELKEDDDDDVGIPPDSAEIDSSVVSGLLGDSVDDQQKLHDDFHQLLDVELTRVEARYKWEISNVWHRLELIHEELLVLNSTTTTHQCETDEINAHLKALQTSILYLWSTLDNLDTFIKLNTMAVYKILKKKRKKWKRYGDSMLDKLAEYKSRLDRFVVDEKLKRYLIQCFKKCQTERADMEGYDSIESLMWRHLTLNNEIAPKQSWLLFFSGACLVLFVDLIVLSCITPRNSQYSDEVVLAVMPIFRMMLMFIVLVWNAGMVMTVFEVYGINYRFMLQINPKCDVQSSTMLSFAALSSFIWIIIFGAFIADFKFALLGNKVWISFYPISLISLILMTCWIPNAHFDYKSRIDTLCSILHTWRSAFILPKEVTFSLNVTGDILTSLSKPLGDLVYSMCFFGKGADSSSVARCPYFSFWIVPLAVALPFWIRFAQCLVRYRKESRSNAKTETMHLANMGKYAFSLNVIFITFLLPKTANPQGIFFTQSALILSYLIATVYSFLWDVYVDWGLFPDPDAFVRSVGRTMFPRWIYYAIAAINLLGRLTWATTLMPLGMLHVEGVQREIIILAISFIEILRRGLWSILRVENEHLTNSSKYRAMLWVPRMMPSQQHQSGGAINEPLMMQQTKRSLTSSIPHLITEANSCVN